jgi:alkylhydroperoxidase family enzyme
VEDEEDEMTLPPLGPDAVAAASREAGLAERLHRVNLLRVALHHPPVARIIGDTIEALVLSGVLDPRLRELAILRVGWRIGAAYEWGNHYPIARRAGLTDDEITAVRAEEPVGLSPAQRCTVRVVDEVLDGVSVAPETLADARGALGDDRALLELVMIPACYRAIGTLLLTFEVPLEEGVEPWPPDGERPPRPGA